MAKREVSVDFSTFDGTEDPKDVLMEGPRSPSTQQISQKKPSKRCRRLMRESKPEAVRLIIGTVFLVGSVAANLTIPLLFGDLVDILTSKQDGMAPDELKKRTIQMAAVAAAYGVLTGIRGYLFNSAGYRVVARLRNKLFTNLMKQEIGFYDQSRTGEILSRLVGDTSSLSDAVTVNISQGLRWGAQLIGMWIPLN